MADPNERDSKIIQFLAEAHSKEAALEAALGDHITRTPKDAYRKRLQEHLRETNRHKKAVEKRIKQLGGTGAVQGLAKTAGEAVGKASSAVKAIATTAREATPLAPSESEVMLKNAQIQYREEADEIAIYKTIQAFAQEVGDKETAQLAKSILREEERMAKYVDGQIKQLTGSVVKAVVPRDQRTKPSRSRRKSSSSRKSSSTSKSSSSSSSRSKSSGGSSKKSSAKKTTAKSSAKKSTASKSTAKKSTARKSTASKSTARKSPAKSAAKKSTASKSGGTRKASGSKKS